MLRPARMIVAVLDRFTGAYPAFRFVANTPLFRDMSLPIGRAMIEVLQVVLTVAATLVFELVFAAVDHIREAFGNSVRFSHFGQSCSSYRPMK